MFPVVHDDTPVYVLYLQGKCPDLSLAGQMGVSQLTNLIQISRGHLDKTRFIQNILLNNLVFPEIYSQAKKLRIPIEQRRIVFLVEPKNNADNLVLEMLKGMFASGSRDFITAVDETSVILVKALEKTEDYEEDKTKNFLCGNGPYGYGLYSMYAK